MHKEAMNSVPLFSIVMPVYNVKQYIKESIESVLNQTFSDFELVLVDDGSTDGCCEICDHYSKKDIRCKVWHQENKGLLLARRAGIKIATGKYLVNVDSDDKCILTMLEDLSGIIKKHMPDMVIYNYSRVDDDGVVTEHAPICEKNLKKLDKQWAINHFVSTVDFNPMWIKCTKLELVDSDYDYSMYGKLNMAEDQLQSAALFEKSNDIYYYSKPLYLYRDNSASITKKQTPKMVIDSLKAKKRVLEMLDNCNSPLLQYQNFYKKYYRTLNMYILKNVKEFNSREDYVGFRKEIEKYELGKVSEARKIDRMIYYLLKSERFFMIKAFGYIYSVLIK